MDLRKTIRKIVTEAAGISFEVREWADIIEDYVDNEIKVATEKQKSEKKIEEPTTDFGVDGDYPEIDPDLGFTHFEDERGEILDTAYITGDDLYITSDVRYEFPNIEREIRDKLFRVQITDQGEIETTPAAGHYLNDADAKYGVDELALGHAQMGRPFYTDSYDYVYASQEGWEYVDDDDDDDDGLAWGSEGWSSEGWENYADTPSTGSGWASLYGSYTSPPRIDKIEIDGTQFPEAYKKFSVDKWVLTSSGRIEYDHWKSGYNDDGKYIVYLNMPMSSIGGTMLVHEIKHAYDDWNRMRHGGKPIRAGWEIQNIYTKDFEKLVLGGGAISPIISQIVRYYYLGSKLETPAYLENEYDQASFTNYRDVGKKLMNFKASNLMNKKGEAAKGLQEAWTNVITKYDIPYFRKFTDVRDFLKATEKYFNKRGKLIVRKIDKMMYVHGRERKPLPKTYTTYTTPTNKPQNPDNNIGD